MSIANVVVHAESVVKLDGRGRLRWLMPGAMAYRHRERRDGRSFVVLIPLLDSSIESRGIASWAEVVALLNPAIDGVTVSARYPDYFGQLWERGSA